MSKQELTIKGAESVCNLSAVEALKNAALRSETLAFVKTLVEEQALAENTKTAVDALRKRQAPIIYRIQSTKLYAKDGYKNMSEYAAAIGLSDASKSLISGLYAAGKVLSDKTAPDSLKSMETSKLAQMGTLIRDEKGYERVKKDAESGALSDMTLADVKTYTASTKAAMDTKPRVVATYTAKRNGSLIVGEDKKPFHWTLDEYKTVIKAEAESCGAEVVTIKGNRFLEVYAGRADLITLEEDKPEKSTNGAVKITTGKDEFLKRARAEGMSDDAIALALRAMGWDK